MKKLIRITTVPLSLDKLLEGQLHFMSDYYEVVAVSSEVDYLKKVALREGVGYFHLEMTRKITPVKDIIAVFRLYRYLRKHQPFIVHTHTPKAGLVGMLAAKFAGVPCRLHTVAGLPLLESKGIKRKILNFVERITSYCATRVYPNSDELRKIMIQNTLCSPMKLKVIGAGSSNGINSTYFSRTQEVMDRATQIKASLGITDQFVFIFVGRIVTDKGINELLRAFQRVNKVESECKLLLVGPLEPDLDPLSSESLTLLQTDPSILSVGYQNDVRPYFALAHCLAFPSYREGFPNVVLQAGAMELPAIVSNINGCNEIIIPQQNGMIIPVKDEEALYTAMLEMVQNKERYQHFKNNARSSITQRYEQKVIWEALLEEYRTFERD